MSGARLKAREVSFEGEYLDKEIVCRLLFVPVDMWTILLRKTVCASPVFLPKQSLENGEMLAFAHIPTGTHPQPRFLYSIGEKRKKASFVVVRDH